MFAKLINWATCDECSRLLMPHEIVWDGDFTFCSEEHKIDYNKKCVNALYRNRPAWAQKGKDEHG